jgi:hypothetical protein
MLAIINKKRHFVYYNKQNYERIIIIQRNEHWQTST